VTRKVSFRRRCQTIETRVLKVPVARIKSWIGCLPDSLKTEKHILSWSSFSEKLDFESGDLGFSSASGMTLLGVYTQVSRPDSSSVKWWK